jgi:predicted PurR-regulated permease PerM
MESRVTGSKSKKSNVLLTIAALVIVVAGMRAASTILIPIMLATFIAVIFMPIFFWLKKKKVPTSLALIIVIISVIAIGFLLAALLQTSLSDFSSTLPVYKQRIDLKKFEEWLEHIGFEIPDQILLDYFDPNILMKLLGSMLSSLGSMLSNTLLIVLIVIFILLEVAGLPEKIKVTFDDPETSLAHINRFVDTVQRYVIIKSVISLITGIFIAVWLAIIGVDFPILWGLLAFLLNYIPSIGSIIAAIPAVLLALIQLGIGEALFAGLGYLVVNFVMGNIIEPRFMGSSLGISTLVVFLSLVFWGWVFGPIGMLLSVPLTMSIKIALDSKENTLWLSTLLSSGIPSPVKRTTNRSK